jgi:hypothetical protein
MDLALAAVFMAGAKLRNDTIYVVVKPIEVAGIGPEQIGRKVTKTLFGPKGKRGHRLG